MREAEQFVAAQREAEMEKLRQLLRKDVPDPIIDPEEAKTIFSKLTLGENPTEYGPASIERNWHNEDILDYWEVEKKDWARFYEMKKRILEIESSSQPDPVEWERLNAAILAMGGWIEKMTFPEGTP